LRLEPFSTVILDAGHGGDDSGALVDGVLEKELTLDVTRRVERRMELAGLRTVLTRTADEYVALPDRAAVANREDDCIFISIHFNENGRRPAATGVETFYAARQRHDEPTVASWLPFFQRASFDSSNLQSQSLASFIQQALVKNTQALDRGVKTQQFFVIANVRHPAVLVEGGFLSNKTDSAQLQTDDYRERLAAAISDGILNYRDALSTSETVLAAAAPGG
jgi:N-acetylmuramoyl-L-alanine amidase